MSERKRQNERLIFLPIVGLLVLNYPLLSLWSQPQLLFGVPLLYLYLFMVWLIFIFFVALTMKIAPPPSPPPDHPKSRRMQ